MVTANDIAAAGAPVVVGAQASAIPAATNPAGDDYLGELLATAVASHPTIAAARATIRAAGADLRSARWQSFPSLSVEGLLLDEPSNSRQASVVVEQPIWAGGRIASSIRKAKADRLAAVAGYREAVLEVMVGVSQSYREYHRLGRKYGVLQRSLTEHRTLVQRMERRVAQEVSPLADLELARSRAAQIEQQVTTTAAQRTSALQKLRELVGDPGMNPGGAPSTDMPLVDFDRDDLVAKALAFDPTRQRLIAEAESAGAAAASARASILPQLSGQYSYNESFGHRVGLVLKAQSDGGFSRFAAASAARQREEAAELRISSTERDLRERTVSDLAEYQSGRERMLSSSTARDAAERVTQSYLRQFVSGRRTWLDVMNAVREATTAENDAIDAEANALQARDRLLMRSGQWPFPAEAGQEP
jgi:adhesin transport system outer membrane protein